MSGYVEVGYVIVLGSIGSYAIGLVRRERSARRRMPAPGTVPADPSLAREGPADDLPAGSPGPGGPS